MGTRPFLSIRIFASSLSTHVTSLPVSARQAPRTNPTYPLPTTAIFMRHKKRGPDGPLKPVRVSPVDCGVNILTHKHLWRHHIVTSPQHIATSPNRQIATCYAVASCEFCST